MLDLKKYRYGGIAVYVRTDVNKVWDEGIVKETQTEYLWDQMDASQFKTAIDLGAHIGSWSVYLRSLNPDCQIICVEPDGENATIMNLNHYGDRKVFRYHAACRYDKGPFVLARNLSAAGSHAVVPKSAAGLYEKNPDREVIPVARVVTLEELMATHGFKTVDIIKIDVEGSETDILGNVAPETLKRVRRIVGEYHGQSDTFEQFLGARLRGLGFSVLQVPHPQEGVDTLSMFLAERT